MFGGTSGALSQSPDSYCAVAKTKVVMMASRCPAPQRVARSSVTPAASGARATSASVASCPARIASIAVASAAAKVGRALERVDAEHEQRVDCGGGIRREQVHRCVEALRASFGGAVERRTRKTCMTRSRLALAFETHLVDVDDHHRRRPAQVQTLGLARALNRGERASHVRQRGAGLADLERSARVPHRVVGLEQRLDGDDRTSRRPRSRWRRRMPASRRSRRRGSARESSARTHCCYRHPPCRRPCRAA